MRVRRGCGYGLRRRAVTAQQGDGWDLLTVPYADSSVLADEVAGYGADVVLIEPDEVRRRVVDRLRAVVGEPA